MTTKNPDPYGPETPGYAKLNELARQGKRGKVSKRVIKKKVPPSQGHDKTH